jgi:hypothetical protein
MNKIEELKPLMKSVSYLISQIEIADNLSKTHEQILKNMEAHNANDAVFPWTFDEFEHERNAIHEYRRQCEKYQQSLTQAVDQLHSVLCQH